MKVKAKNVKKARLETRNSLVVVPSIQAIPDKEHGFSRAAIICSENVPTATLSLLTGYLPTGTSAELHSHDDSDTVIHIVSGFGFVRWVDKFGETQKTKMSEGSGIFIPRGVPHAPTVESPTGLIYTVARNTPERD